MTHKEVIEKFYTSFSNGNSKEMIACYHDRVIFEDPVFGRLKGERVFEMWNMLLSNKSNDTTITFNNVEIVENTGRANWIATYKYGPKKRPVINNVSAYFEFKQGKIIKHVDSFDVWKWTRQALGISGYIMGWTPMMMKKIQKTTHKRLDDYISSKNK